MLSYYWLLLLLFAAKASLNESQEFGYFIHQYGNEGIERM